MWRRPMRGSGRRKILCEQSIFLIDERHLRSSSSSDETRAPDQDCCRTMSLSKSRTRFPRSRCGSARSQRTEAWPQNALLVVCRRGSGRRKILCEQSIFLIDERHLRSSSLFVVVFTSDGCGNLQRSRSCLLLPLTRVSARARACDLLHRVPSARGHVFAERFLDQG